ncbi:hypothetical protein PoB_000487700 [Plakobranchus ocellatus]|uniref:Uncharacterized protein n=1 Tax=Plakobranchus ocellatus TaxID=259542 RepID=A0AAV3Y7E4_9GAST|nr:hypothetical protein PoB_000487700 [Plakobranchus ocellatus]
MPLNKIGDSISTCGCYRKDIPHELSTLKDLPSEKICYDNTRMREILEVEPHNIEATIIEMAYSLIHYDVVSKHK